MKSPSIIELVEEMLRAGFDVAMGGRYDKSEKWNKDWQIKEYERVVKKYNKVILKLEKRARQAERERITKFIENYYKDKKIKDTPDYTAFYLALKGVK